MSDDIKTGGPNGPKHETPDFILDLCKKVDDEYVHKSADRTHVDCLSHEFYLKKEIESLKRDNAVLFEALELIAGGCEEPAPAEGNMINAARTALAKVKPPTETVK